MRKGSVSTTEVLMNCDGEILGTGVEVSRDSNDNKTHREALISRHPEEGYERSQLEKMSTLLRGHKRVKFCWNLEDRLRRLQKLTNPN